MMGKYNSIEHEGKKYPVSYSGEYPCIYASVTINGVTTKGRGDDIQSAYWSLEQKLYQLTLSWPQS